MAAAAAMLKEFCERCLLPKLEEHIARLNFGISAARKGLKNRLTRLWKGAAGDAGPAQVGQLCGCSTACQWQDCEADRKEWSQQQQHWESAPATPASYNAVLP
jgi:hypothetical protein